MPELGDTEAPGAKARSHLLAAIRELDDGVHGAPIPEVVERVLEREPIAPMVLEELVELLNSGDAYSPRSDTIRMTGRFGMDQEGGDR